MRLIDTLLGLQMLFNYIIYEVIFYFLKIYLLIFSLCHY